ncbi:hypothetical protein AL035_17895 [Salipiger aestuarii]|uniref:Roadblock/LAMTOR2 domain-containing protein n=1 Tax=Salipiger aestuarii TaxID=568098 RepID=A0A327XQY4_9RHOB|nr:hypothetical protein [Salipiger aestuarii]KAB2539638.1 hypothetical protein AL035_17895 [Salipiger aestuarii]RAK10457.1 hypothetical protein ATI53_105621 [Salipiger aestuarii]
MTRTTLADVRAAVPGCELAALFDLGARTVLLSDSAVRLGQEHLDVLEAEARRIFDAGAVAPVMVAGPRGLRVFLLAPGPSPEALCCLLAPGADASGVADAARAVFAAAGAGE